MFYIVAFLLYIQEQRYDTSEQKKKYLDTIDEEAS